ncbi:hypothetical protein ACVWZM_002958 [Bradyrhizobium sp. USDA 4501]
MAEIAEIDALLAGIKKAFADNADIGLVISDLKELREAFGKSSKTGAIPKSSKIHKAFGSGNKIANIPDALKPFETFIKSQEPARGLPGRSKETNYSNSRTAALIVRPR